MSSTLVGYDKLTAIFARLSREGTLTHAYCFVGDRGIGKATFAASFAAYLECGSFEFGAAALMDITTTAPGENRTIGIDAIRDIRRFLWQTPFRSPRRTVVIDGAEALTPEAQGALLKIVEEPPPHALLLVVTSQADLLTPPLRSRLSVVYVPRLPAAHVERFLLQHRSCSPAAASRIAARSFGSIGCALELSKPEAKPLGDSEVSPRDPGAEIERMLVEAHANGFRGYLPERPQSSGRAGQPGRLAWLAERLELVRRFNVNPVLQERAIRERLGRLPRRNLGEF
ncbi:MAG: AAA family ATPase [bacterium]|nr:AAA family ATPase [bacterium]